MPATELSTSRRLGARGMLPVMDRPTGADSILMTPHQAAFTSKATKRLRVQTMRPACFAVRRLCHCIAVSTPGSPGRLMGPGSDAASEDVRADPIGHLLRRRALLALRAAGHAAS